MTGLVYCTASAYYTGKRETPSKARRLSVAKLVAPPLTAGEGVPLEAPSEKKTRFRLVLPSKPELNARTAE